MNIGRPKLNHDPTHDRFPFVLRWKGKQSGPTANRDVVFYRKALDSLKPCDVSFIVNVLESIKFMIILENLIQIVCFFICRLSGFLIEIWTVL